MKTITIVTAFLLISLISNSQVPSPTLQQGEYWTQLFTYYDYQTNGSIRYIVQNPSNPSGLCTILMAQQDSISLPGSFRRYIYFSYSSNGGKNWTKSIVNNDTTSGFPCMDIRNGTPVIAAHWPNSSSQRLRVFADAFFGGFSFTQLPELPAGYYIQWPHLTVSSNGNIIVVATGTPPGPNSHYTVYNGTSWSPLIELPNTGGPSGQFSTESGPGGAVYIFSTYNFAIDITKLWTSMNNGATFTLQTGSNAPPEFITDSAPDTMYAYIDGGKSGIYLGSEVHLVYSVYAASSEALPNPPNTAWFKKTKIVHWSPGTGIDTVAGRYNMPLMTDTLTHALMTPLCQPSMGFYNGYIYVTFTAFLRGNKQTVNDGSQVNAGEIFLSRSSDNGNTWSTPVNITNTPNIEEKHSSAVRRFTLPVNDSVGVYYLRDLKAGGWVNIPSWGKAPVYGIYKKLGPSVLGIKQDIEITHEYRLFQNYPNPFNPTTKISYYLEKSGNVSLRIYNILGEVIKILVNENQTKGAKEIDFDASNLPSGIYYYTLESEDFRDTKKMVLIK